MAATAIQDGDRRASRFILDRARRAKLNARALAAAARLPLARVRRLLNGSQAWDYRDAYRLLMALNIPTAEFFAVVRTHP